MLLQGLWRLALAMPDPHNLALPRADRRCLQVGIFNLWSKSIVDIRESYDQFSITEGGMELTPETHLFLRFRRRFDDVFNPNQLQVWCVRAVVCW